MEHTKLKSAYSHEISNRINGGSEFILNDLKIEEPFELSRKIRLRLNYTFVGGIHLIRRLNLIV